VALVSADWNTPADWPGIIEGQWQTLARGLLCIVLLTTLAACAGSVASPVAVLDLPQANKASLHLIHISAEAPPGTATTPDDLNRIVQRVTADIQASSPAIRQPASAVQAKLMKITVTRYDEGNAFARFMLAGLGQIYIEGDVELRNASAREVQSSKDFAFGGLYGGMTTIREVEKGFARSVAAMVTQQA
jgi:hypothetical protein